MADRGKSDEGPKLVEQKKEFLESFFEKGAQFTRELLRENDRLRHRIAELEEQLRRDSPETTPEKLEQIERKLARRYAEIERENNALASLFVAQSQLHASLRVAHVTEVILEVLLNFVGAKDFALLVQRGDTIEIVASHGEVPANAAEAPGVRDALERGERRVVDQAAGGAPVVCFPLRAADGIGGAIAIWSYLPQKEVVEDIDHRMFDLISESGGLALQAARCYESNEEG